MFSNTDIWSHKNLFHIVWSWEDKDNLYLYCVVLLYLT